MSCGETVDSGGTHEEACEQMADAQHFLSLDPAVGEDSDDGGHEKRNYALNSVEPSDLFLQSD